MLPPNSAPRMMRRLLRRVRGRKVGLELFTVRDVMTDPKSYEATLEKISRIGFREIEPAGGYAGLNPAVEADAKKFRAMLNGSDLACRALIPARRKNRVWKSNSPDSRLWGSNTLIFLREEAVVADRAVPAVRRLAAVPVHRVADQVRGCSKFGRRHRML